MYRKLVLLTSVVFLVSACLPKNTEPTLSLEEIQATAQASALTAVAQTEMAKPSNTPEPTPTIILPTPTEIVAVVEVTEVPVEVAPPTEIPVVVVVQDPAATEASTGDGCDFLNHEDKGKRVGVTIVNKSGAFSTVSLTLYPTALGACGSMSGTIDVGGSVTYSIPEGCYFVYAWNSGKEQTTAQAEICFKASDGNQTWFVKKTIIES